MKIAITGARGFIGGRFAQYAATRPEAPAIKTDAAWPVAYRGKWDELLDGCDAVWHFAAAASEFHSHFQRERYARNVELSAAVINAAIRQGVRRFVFASSVAVYGNSTSPTPYDERARCQPIDPYGASKLATEWDLRAASRTHGLQYSILRLHNVYGPGCDLRDTSRNVVSIWCRSLLRNRDLVVHGDCGRQFTLVDAILPTLWYAGTEADWSNHTVNVGSNVVSRVRDVAESLIAIAGRGSIIDGPPRPEVSTIQVAHDLQDSLTVLPEVPIAEGLSRTWEWARTVGAARAAEDPKIWPAFELPLPS